MPGRITEANKIKFLKKLAQTANVTRSAKAIGKSRTAVYNLRNDDEQFAANWDEAIETALDEIEAKLIEKAKSGESDTAGIFMLKTRRREIYGDRIEHLGNISHDHTHHAVSETDRRITEMLTEGEGRNLPAPVPH